MSPTLEKEKYNYPSPVATHEEVVNGPTLFLDTLKSFHFFMGTKFMVPVVAKKELDLHALYVEVTKKGGYDKVVSEKKWREISSLLNFSPTATSASFVLKKHYLNFLYHYEQVYFFNLQGPVISTPAPGPSPFGSDLKQPNNVQESICGAVGTIHGKFDCGYLVTVRLGQDLLSGVLYHPTDKPCTPSSTEDLSMAIVPYDPLQPLRASGKRRRKKKRWGGDPSHPKPNRSGYNFFFSEKHSLLKSHYPERGEREFTKMIGELWNNLSTEEKMHFSDEVQFMAKLSNKGTDKAKVMVSLWMEFIYGVWHQRNKKVFEGCMIDSSVIAKSILFNVACYVSDRQKAMVVV